MLDGLIAACRVNKFMKLGCQFFGILLLAHLQWIVEVVDVFDC